jgi:hypothetical protein
MTEPIPIKQIKQDSALQPRAKMDTGIIDEYTEAMKAGAIFPAIVVFKIKEEYFLVDGYHRFMAAQGAAIKEILCDVRIGTMRDAILFSAGVNATHGIRRTNADKNRAVLILLKDKEWTAWNDSKIAAACNVSPELVVKIRKSILPKSVSTTPEKKKVMRAGKIIKMDTSKIGKNRKSAKPADPAPEEAPATMPAPDESRPVPAPQPVRPGPAAPAQPSLAAQMSGTVPPEPAAHNPPPCKGGGGCTRGKFRPRVSKDAIKGDLCDAIGVEISQLPGNMCPYDIKLERPAPVESGFHQAGSGKPDLIVPGVPKVPTDPALVCLGLVAHVLPKEDGEFVRQVAEKEFGGDLVLAVKGIIARVREA